MSQAKNWCFTLNNYSDDDTNRINSLIERNRNVKYLIYGKETGESGTPHLQGLICFGDKLRLLVVKTLIGSNPHLEVCRNVSASLRYCKKEGDWYEFGDRTQRQGKRNDLEKFKDDVKNGMLSLKEVREKHSDVYARCTRFCLEYIQDHYPSVHTEEFELRPWQNVLKRKLEENPDRRKIIFLVDKIGNSGKSWFAHYYTNKNEDTSQVILPAKKADMAFLLKPGLRVIFIDAPRSKQGEFIQYDFLEDLKNGYVFSTKYESRIKTYKPMHVVVNMNEDPDTTKLSIDRYDVINIRHVDLF
jgi:hypothetical protein